MNHHIESVAIDITYHCNFRCRHCFNSSGTHNFAQEMSDATLKRIVKEISKFRPRGACICGGEPLMRKDVLIEIIKEYSETNPPQSFNMVSNGYFINQSVARLLKEAGINSVQISLDGAKPESHNWLRKNDNAYERAIMAIKFLVQEGVSVNIACVPHQKNIDELDALIVLCKNLGITTLRLQPFMNLGRGRGIQQFILSDTDYFLLARKLSKIEAERTSNDDLHLEWGDPIEHLSIISTGQGNLNYFQINAYGDIILSPYLPLKFGNIKNHTISEYLNSGLSDMLSNPFVMAIAVLINDASKMSKEITSKLPAIFSGNDIVLDLLHDDITSKTNELLYQYALV